tara:strand:+ start:9761 stop:10327 length:567 start_codon:yes stop_codon:yes gene_type:complete
MKAIKVTHKLKHDNPELFGAVDSIYSGRIPKTFVRGQEVCLAYDIRVDLQALDGWQEVVEPSIGENQKRGALIEVNGEFTYGFINLTAEEIAARDEITMPRNTFKLALLQGYGVKNSDVDALFSVLISQGLATEIQVEEMKILWYESGVFKNTTPELFQFAATLTAMNPSISITEAQLKKIFTDHAGI